MTASFSLYSLIKLIFNKYFKIRKAGMNEEILWDSEDEEEGLVKELNQTYKPYQMKHFRQSAQQPGIQWEQQQVSTESFTKGITNPPKQLESTNNRTITEMIRSSTSSTNQLNRHHSANIFERMDPFSSQVERRDEEPKSAVLLIETPMTQRQISRKAFLQRIARRDEYQKRRQDQRKEYLAKVKKSIISHTMAQIKYLDDVDIEQFQKKQERRKARQAKQAQQSQGSFMQAIMQLLNFRKQSKKRTQ